jgi:hypothetical protein
MYVKRTPHCARVLGGEAEERDIGVHFFWLLFFGQTKKSDPLAAGEWKVLL